MSLTPSATAVTSSDASIRYEPSPTPQRRAGRRVQARRAAAARGRAAGPADAEHHIGFPRERVGVRGARRADRSRRLRVIVRKRTLAGLRLRDRNPRGLGEGGQRVGRLRVDRPAAAHDQRRPRAAQQHGQAVDRRQRRAGDHVGRARADRRRARERGEPVLHPRVAGRRVDHALLVARVVVRHRLGLLEQRLPDAGDVAVPENAEAPSDEPLLGAVALAELHAQEPDQRLGHGQSHPRRISVSSRRAERVRRRAARDGRAASRPRPAPAAGGLRGDHPHRRA